MDFQSILLLLFGLALLGLAAYTRLLLDARAKHRAEESKKTDDSIRQAMESQYQSIGLTNEVQALRRELTIAHEKLSAIEMAAPITVGDSVQVLGGPRWCTVGSIEKGNATIYWTPGMKQGVFSDEPTLHQTVPLAILRKCK